MRETSRVVSNEQLVVPKVLLCPPVGSVFPVLDDASIFNYKKPKTSDVFIYRAERINTVDYQTDVKSIKGEHKDCYQCLYCKVVDKNKVLILTHLANFHTDLPVLYYNPGNERKPQETKPTMKQDQNNGVKNQKSSPPSSSNRHDSISPQLDLPGPSGLSNPLTNTNKTTIEFVNESQEPRQEKPTTSWSDDDDDTGVFIEPPEDTIARDLTMSDEEEERKPFIPSLHLTPRKRKAIEQHTPKWRPSTPGGRKAPPTPGRHPKSPATPARHPKSLATPRRSSRLFESDSDEELLPHNRQRPPSGFQNNPIQAIKEVPTTGNPNVKIVKCLVQGCHETFLQSKIQFHMKKCHNTDVTIKCEDCDEFGSIKSIKDHIKAVHGGKGTVVNIVVPVDDTEPRIMAKVDSGSLSKKRTMVQLDLITLPSKRANVSAPKTPTRRRKNDPPPKGYLMESLKNGTYLGPLENDMTAKKRSGGYDED